MGDGNTIFYGSTSVAPCKNGMRLFHVELIVESAARRLTKRHKVGESVNWYKHTERNGNTLNVDKEEKDKELDRNDDDNESKESDGDKSLRTYQSSPYFKYAWFPSKSPSP